MNKKATEARNPKSFNLDLMSTEEILKLINAEDQTVPQKIAESKNLKKINAFVDAAIIKMKDNGRLIYFGAGTSGRLGVLDAVENVPTFGVDKTKVQGLIAGGSNAFLEAVEGAEDSEELGAKDLEDINLTSNDVVLGLAASGSTPYVIGGLKYANEIGAITGSFSSNINAKISEFASYPIEIETGAEVLTGSTRMKAGTAEKLVLNMISTTIMVKIGKVYQNLMVDVKPTNKKLVDRAIRIISEATGKNYQESEEFYLKANKNPKKAIVMIENDVDLSGAEQILQKNSGFIR